MKYRGATPSKSVRGAHPRMVVMDEMEAEQSLVGDFGQMVRPGDLARLGQLVRFDDGDPDTTHVGTLEHYDSGSDSVYVNVPGPGWDAIRMINDPMPSMNYKVIPKATWTHRITRDQIVSLTTPPKSMKLGDIERWLDEA